MNKELIMPGYSVHGFNLIVSQYRCEVIVSANNAVTLGFVNLKRHDLQAVEHPLQHCDTDDVLTRTYVFDCVGKADHFCDCLFNHIWKPESEIKPA